MKKCADMDITCEQVAIEYNSNSEIAAGKIASNRRPTNANYGLVYVEGTMRERDLWQVVARHLRKRYGWPKDWWAGSGKPFGNLRAGMGQGQPDVVGVSEKQATPEIHFVEGKILRPSRHKFNETISQLRDWGAYANYLWAAFARADWELVSRAQREEWETNLRYEGIGLILVKDGRATIPLKSRSNSQVEAENQRLVLERIGSKRAKTASSYLLVGAKRCAGRFGGNFLVLRHFCDRSTRSRARVQEKRHGGL
jgi:hypothetical protein